MMMHATRCQIALLSTCLFLCGQASVAFADQQNIVVVIDDSGSMEDRMRTSSGRKQRIEVAKSALIQVLQQLPPETQVGVLALNTRVQNSNWIVPFGANDARQLEQNIRSLRARGGTPLGEYLKIGVDALLEARKNQVYGSYRLLVVTDGEANDRRLVEQYLPDILSRGVTVDVIGVDMQARHSLATRVHSYRSANDETALQQALSEVFAETSTADQDAEDDFAILASLPDGFAEQAIEALAGRGNSPVGEVAGNQESFEVSYTVNSRSGGTSGRAVASFAFGGVFCCFGGILLLVIVVGAIIVSRRR